MVCRKNRLVVNAHSPLMMLQGVLDMCRRRGAANGNASRVTLGSSQTDLAVAAPLGGVLTASLMKMTKDRFSTGTELLCGNRKNVYSVSFHMAPNGRVASSRLPTIYIPHKICTMYSTRARTVNYAELSPSIADMILSVRCIIISIIAPMLMQPSTPPTSKQQALRYSVLTMKNGSSHGRQRVL